MADAIFSNTVQTLIDQGREIVSKLVDANATYTSMLKKLAVVVVDLRTQPEFTDAKGQPDIFGRSQAYRDAVAKLYGEIELDTRTQAALRYHIGNELEARELKQAKAPKTDAQKASDKRAAEMNGFNAVVDRSTPEHLVEVLVEKLGSDPVAVVAEATRVVGTVSLGGVPLDKLPAVREALLAHAAAVRELLDKLPPVTAAEAA